LSFFIARPKKVRLVIGFTTGQIHRLPITDLPITGYLRTLHNSGSIETLPLRPIPPDRLRSADRGERLHYVLQ